jgi:hypothetical protein
MGAALQILKGVGSTSRGSKPIHEITQSKHELRPLFRAVRVVSWIVVLQQPTIS